MTSCCRTARSTGPPWPPRRSSTTSKRANLNGIVHPLVGRRREEIIAAVSDDAVVVEDIPLLVETGMAPMFPLVVVVHADDRNQGRPG